MLSSELSIIAAILTLGILSQWIAWILRLPSIVVLLVVGLIFGPGLGWISPDAIFGRTLFPIVSLSVGLILFEGGLSLKLEEFRSIGAVVRRLATLGVVITFAVATWFAHFIFEFPWKICALLGAMLVVTGPTVIIPLLQHVRPKKHLSSALRWEGIVTDPIGAVFAVLIFEAIIQGGLSVLPTVAAYGIFKTVAVGLLFGFGATQVLIWLIRRHWIPDHLESPITLMFVVSSYAISHLIQHESGLLTATLMGFFLTNQRQIPIKSIVEFKETLRVILIAVLFIVLSARLDIQTLSRIGIDALYFLAALIFVVRPLSVFISTAGVPNFAFKEKLFLCAVCPRGIVAAAVASLFGIELTKMNLGYGEEVSLVIFVTILGTVTIYGLLARPIAKILGLAKQGADLVLIAGSPHWGLQLAKTLQDLGVGVIVADTNLDHIRSARARGLSCIYGNVFDESLLHSIGPEGFDKFLGITQNDEVNTLAAIHFADYVGIANVFTVRVASERNPTEYSSSVKGIRKLFNAETSYELLEKCVLSGDEIVVLSSDQTADIKLKANKKFIPLFSVSSLGVLMPITENFDATQATDKIIALARKG